LAGEQAERAFGAPHHDGGTKVPPP
jgi:hypothetical protein